MVEPLLALTVAQAVTYKKLPGGIRRQALCTALLVLGLRFLFVLSDPNITAIALVI